MPMPVFVPATVEGLPSVAEHPRLWPRKRTRPASQNRSRTRTRKSASSKSNSASSRGRRIASWTHSRRSSGGAGNADDSGEKFAKLETLRKHAKRLDMVAEIAQRALQEAKQEAVRVLSVSASEKEFKPAARKAALALLELIKAKAKEARRATGFAMLAFTQPGGTFDAPILSRFDNWSHRFARP